MKYFLVSLFLVIVVLLSPIKAYAYTTEDVAQHNTVGDCWMIYDNGVYDLTSYIKMHDRYMDISSRCGLDMTNDFETKAGTGRDHKNSSYSLLESFKIGEITKVSSSDTTNETVNTTDTKVTEETNNNSPYNLLIPVLVTSFVYWLSYVLFFKKNRKNFNGFWNTILLLSFVIPSFGFGIFMMLRYSFKDLYNIDFDFMYWHVELSVVMGVLAINHILQRFSLYLIQLGVKK
jgi:cytochrome b involved in lipid metabolism